jgi:hypothetical protein
MKMLIAIVALTSVLSGWVQYAAAATLRRVSIVISVLPAA